MVQRTRKEDDVKQGIFKRRPGGNPGIDPERARLLDELGGLINRDHVEAAFQEPPRYQARTAANVEDAQMRCWQVGKDK